MAFEDQLQTHWWHELPFYSVAMVSYVVLFIMNPPMNWFGCKYAPTCSEYMYDAVKKYGVFKGISMGSFRILRCNPLAKGGFDPVK
jgi:putative membrane protein insertion efficiency factor